MFYRLLLNIGNGRSGMFGQCGRSVLDNPLSSVAQWILMSDTKVRLSGGNCDGHVKH
jgi:hypothetical protein